MVLGFLVMILPQQDVGQVAVSHGIVRRDRQDIAEEGFAVSPMGGLLGGRTMQIKIAPTAEAARAVRWYCQPAVRSRYPKRPE